MTVVGIEKYNEAYIRVICEPSEAFELRDYFTFDVPGAKYMPSFKSKAWDGKIRLFNVTNGLIYAGLRKYVEKFCEERGYTAHHLTDFSPEEFYMEQAESFIAQLKNLRCLTKDPRGYQMDGFAHAIRERRTFLLSPTASGKSLMMYLIARYHVSRNCLIIVPTTGLVLQMKNDFIDYGMEEEDIHCIYSGQTKSPDEWITISTWQSIYKMPKAWFANFEVVIGDEAHGFKAASLKSIMTKLDKCKYRIGVSGTLDGTKTNKLVLEGLFGPVYTVTTMKELMDAGHVSNLKIKCLVLSHPKGIRDLLKKLPYPEEIKALIKCTYRNRFIKKLALSQEGNTLVLFRYIEHGDELHRIINNETPYSRNVYLVHGGVEAEEREVIRGIVEEQDNAIIVASMGTFRQGVNIKRLHNIIFAHPGKGKIAILQSIGRSLRVAGDKVYATLYDLADDMTIRNYKNFGYQHFTERVKIYIEEKFDYRIYNIEIGGHGKEASLLEQ